MTRSKLWHAWRLNTTSAILLLLLADVVPADAEDIFNTLPGYDQHSAWAATGPNATPIGGGTPYGDNDIAWRFSTTGTPHYLATVELPLAEASWLSGRIADIMVWTDTVTPDFGHVPGQMLESVRITTVPIGSPAFCTASFSGTNFLAADTYYWVVVSATDNEQIRWYQDEFNLPNARGAWRKDQGVWQAPTLGGNAGAMRVAGTVAQTPEPRVTQVLMTGSGFVMRGTNGIPLASYHVLHSTNLDLSVSLWSAVATNQFDSNGAFDCTNAVPLGSGRGYFRLLCPAAAAARP